ncbi:MAG: ABC transporter substrate-binding protein, partial [Bacteroidota bacterium]
LDPSDKKLKPLLATDLAEVSADGLRFTYQIKAEATWPDGAPLTAADFAFSAKAIMFPLTNAVTRRAYLSTLQDIQLYPEDPKKLTIICNKPYHYNPYFGGIIYVLDRRFYDPDDVLGPYTLSELIENNALQEDEKLLAWANEFNDPKYGQDPQNLRNGSGPYQVSEWVQGERIVFTRNENYWGKNEQRSPYQQFPPEISFASSQTIRL